VLDFTRSVMCWGIIGQLAADWSKSTRFFATVEGSVIYKHACALGCEGVVSSGWARHTAPAGHLIGSRSRTRLPRRYGRSKRKCAGRLFRHICQTSLREAWALSLSQLQPSLDHNPEAPLRARVIHLRMCCFEKCVFPSTCKDEWSTR
jgi:hypothetical protein